MLGAFAVPREHQRARLVLVPARRLLLRACSRLFTMYLPPLFPTLLRTTGAGFCYNIGRIAAAVGTVVFGLFAPVGDYRQALLYAGGWRSWQRRGRGGCRRDGRSRLGESATGQR